MRIKNPISLVLGAVLSILGIVSFIMHIHLGALIMALMGSSLVYLGLSESRKALIVFGHVCIVAGCLLVTWGLYLLPYSKPTLAHIFLRPLFWGMISIFGGICANYHGFCRCIRG